MKRSFKVRTLALGVALSLVLGSSTDVFAAALKFDNSQSNPGGEATCDLYASFNASQTELHPGDKFNMFLDVDQMPSNGQGLCSVSISIVYDSAVLDVTIDEKEDPEEEDVPTMSIGPLGEAFSFGEQIPKIIDDEGTLKNIRVAAAKAPSKNCPKVTGNIIGFEFTVKETANDGPITMYLEAGDGTDSNGMTFDGVTKVSASKYDMNTDLEYRIDTSSADALKVVIPATGITYTGDTVELDTNKNKTKDVSASVLPTPSNTSDSISWSSSNTSIATVNNGVITAVGAGKTTIKAKIGAYEVEIPVNVTLALAGIHMQDSKLTLDKTTNPTASIASKVVAEPAGAGLGTVTYESDNTSVATVDGNGNVTAVGKGTANITVTAGEYTTTLPVTVTASLGEVTFDRATLSLDTKDNASYDLNNIIVLDPEDAEITSKSFVSSDPSVATVDSSTGVVTAKGNGETTITATINGKVATIKVAVTIPLDGIKVSGDSVTVYKNASNSDIKVTADPTGASWTDLTAEVTTGSDVATATVTNDGTLTVNGLKAGTAVVTVKANNNAAMTKTVNVTVKENKVKEVNVTSNVTGDFYKNETMSLTATPVGTETDHEITDDVSVKTWKSSDETVATVDPQTGAVTGLKAGTATITCTIAGVDGTYNVTVKENPIASVEITSDKTGNFFINDTMNLTAKAVAENPNHVTTDDTTTSWSVADPTVASCTNGVVKGLKEGTTTVTATIGSASKTYTVDVKANPIDSITITSDNTGVFFKGQTMNLTATPVAKYPEHETTDTVTKAWKSSNEAVATVTNDGVVTGLKAGTATMTCTIGSKTATYEVEVKENKIIGVSIKNTGDTEALVKNDTTKLEPEYEMEIPGYDPTETPTVSWTSDKPEVVSVDKDGNVTALSEGVATITLDVNGMTAQLQLSVTEIHIEGIEFTEESLKAFEEGDFYKGETKELEFDILPAETTDDLDSVLDMFEVTVDEDLVDYKIEIDKETGKGKIILTLKENGEAEISVAYVDADEDEEPLLSAKFEITDKPVIEPVVDPNPTPDTGDMPVAMMTTIMLMSVTGIYVVKKELLK